MTLVLIDADILIYKAANAGEEICRWPDGMWTYHADEKHGEAYLEKKLAQILADTQASQYIMCFSDTKNNYRKSLYSDYKANRTTRKPLLLHYLRDFCEERYECCSYASLEADDVLGILATSPENKGDCIIATIDKDLLQIPTIVYNIDTRHTSLPESRDVEKIFFEQVLTGDRVDNYPGCPGIGVKRAAAILQDFTAPEDMWKAVVKEYTKKGLREEDAITQARCAHILQHQNYGADGVIKLWGLQYA